MGVKISLNGATELKVALEKNADLSKVKEAVKENGSQLQENAQRNAPVDTGELKRSIGLEITNGGMSAESEATVEYAPYVEYGTRYMSAQPYMWPAFQVQKIKFIKDVKNAIKRR